MQDTASMLARIEQVLTARGWSRREWSRQAGLTEESHLAGIMRRLRAGDAGMSTTTLAALATAANVSLDWLVFGRGEMTPGHPPPAELYDPEYPSRAVAVAAARVLGYSERVIREVMLIRGFAVDPGVEFWIQQLHSAHARALADAEPHESANGD